MLRDALGSAMQGTDYYEVFFEIGVELFCLQVNIFLYTDFFPWVLKFGLGFGASLSISNDNISKTSNFNT